MSEDPDGRYHETMPDQPHDIANLWRTMHRVERMWKWGKAVTAVVENWKMIAVSLALGLAIGGKELIQMLGVPLP